MYYERIFRGLVVVHKKFTVPDTIGDDHFESRANYYNIFYFCCIGFLFVCVFC